MNPTILSMYIARTYGRPLRHVPMMSLRAFLDSGGVLQSLNRDQIYSVVVVQP
jgi:hypothetical protein